MKTPKQITIHKIKISLNNLLIYSKNPRLPAGSPKTTIKKRVFCLPKTGLHAEEPGFYNRLGAFLPCAGLARPLK
jgi:hypothetical protein